MVVLITHSSLPLGQNSKASLPQPSGLMPLGCGVACNMHLRSSRVCPSASCMQRQQGTPALSAYPQWSSRAARSVVAHGTWPGSTNNYMNGYPQTANFIAQTAQPVTVEEPVPPEQLTNGEAEAAANRAAQVAAGSGALSKTDFPKFVQYFRNAAPYIAGHRGRTFVVVLPGNVTTSRYLLQSIMSDVALLHALGVRLVVVAGAQPQIDALLEARGMKPKYVGGYRVTDKAALKVAMEAAGQVETTCKQILSKGPAIPMIRRHTKGEGEIHYQPAVNVVSGNFIVARRRGVVMGVDFIYTGEVRSVLKDRIERQLDDGNLVLLSNLGYSPTGDVLNCNTADVGLHAAIELQADKLFFLHLDEVKELTLPPWLPVSDAQELLLSRVQDTLSKEQLAAVKEAISKPAAGSPPPGASPYRGAWPWEGHASAQHMPSQADEQKSMVASRLASRSRQELVVDLDVWSASGLPTAVSTCVVACCKGIKRAHLVDARTDGGLLLECYSRDGIGTMISADFYEGIRKALPTDLDAIQALLRPMEEAGALVKRSREELANMLQDFTVIERENKVLACALLLPLGVDHMGVSVAEVGAFCVDPAFRGSGRGDSLLDYVEQEARVRGVQRLVLLTTRTADWFEQRDFKWVGAAYENELLPEARRARVNPARNSQLYAKAMEAHDGTLTEPGKRIGF